MTTRMSTGHASTDDAGAAGRLAAERALEGLRGGPPPAFGVVFATSKLDLEALVRGACDALGDVPLLGCTSAGEFADAAITDGGVALGLVASDALGLAVGAGEGLRANTPRAVRAVVSELRGSRRAAPEGASHRTVLLLTDGLAGNGEGLVDALAMEVGGGVTIAGGAAGDDAAFKETFVALGRRVLRDAVVAVELTTPHKVGVGVHHGWCAASEPGTVTRAEGARVLEIDGAPAIEMYRAYAARKGVTLTAENQNQFVFTHELGIVLMNDELKVRAPLSVHDDGSIACATEVPQGMQVRIVEGDHDAIVAAARTAAEEAVRGLAGRPCAGAIVFDCVARKLVLGAGFAREVEAFRDVVRAPVVGFNTYGEIARVRGQVSGFHNTTAVVAALPA